MGLAVVARNTVPGTSRHADIREAVAELHRCHPRAGANRLAEMLVEQMEEDRPLLLDAGRFLIEKILAAAETRARQSQAAPSPKERAARRVSERKTVQAIATKLRQTVLLDSLMPNGKPMRYCTGQEMSGFSAAYQAIATMVGPDCLVGEILVESQIRELLGSA
jgi:hypothetical protein